MQISYETEGLPVCFKIHSHKNDIAREALRRKVAVQLAREVYSEIK